MGQLGTFVIEDQLAGAVPGPVDSGAAKIFQLCGMEAEQPPTGAQVATTCSHKRFPAHRVDGAEVEIFPALRNGGERAGDGIIAGTSLRHKGFPAHRAGNDGLAGFSGLRKGGWPRDDAELGAGVWPVGKCVGTASGAPPPAQGTTQAGRAKKKSRAKGPAQVDQVGMSGCSVLAPTTHRGQTSQTCAEEQHGGRLGDGRLLTVQTYVGNRAVFRPKSL